MIWQSSQHSELIMDNPLDVAQVGRMFVTAVSFTWHEGQQVYNDKTHNYDKLPGHWTINARLSDKPSQYGDGQSMNINVEQGIGQKLAAVLMPVVIADASKKAQQLADDSKAMLEALGERTIACLADMPSEKE